MQTRFEPAARTLSRFVADAEPERVPEHVRDDVCRRVLDTLGVGLAATGLPDARAVLTVMRGLGGAADATAIGSRTRLPAPAAALVNGTLAHAHDFDDTDARSFVHISSVVVPAALATAETVDAGGASCALALLVGAEVGLCIARTLGPRLNARGYHATSVCGPFAAAAVAAKLLRLDEAGIAHALGLAGSRAGGLLQGTLEGSSVKRVHPGWSAQAGIEAALLAQQGLTGPASVLEGPKGLYAAFLHGETCDSTVPLGGLGSRWLYPEVVYKPYPSAAWTHASIDALGSILARTGAGASDIQAIDCTLPAAAAALVGSRDAPITAYQAKTSLAYTLAMRVVLGRVAVGDFTDATIRDPAVDSVAARVTCHMDPDMRLDDFPAKVAVTLLDGRRFRESVSAQRGTSRAPMTTAEHQEKFRSNATKLLRDHQVGDLEAAVASLWDLRSIAEDLMSLTIPRLDGRCTDSRAG